MKKKYLKCISAAIAAMFALQACFYPDAAICVNKDKLATPSIFQKSSPSEGSEEFKRSVLSDIKFLTAAFSISSHFLLDNKGKDTFVKTIKDEFRNNPSFLDGIDLDNVRVEDGIVYIPHKKDGVDYEVRICSKEKLSSLGKDSSQWAVSANWGIQVVRKAESGRSDENDSAESMEGLDEPLMGHRVKEEELSKIRVKSWREIPEFIEMVSELEKIIREKAPASLRDSLLEVLENFKEGKDGRQLGVASSYYKDSKEYYVGFGTSRAIAISSEFLDEKNPLSKYRLEALFHELFHAFRDSVNDETTTTGIDAVAHFEAIRLGAQIFWGLNEQETNWPSLKALENHPANEFGRAIRNWKYGESRIQKALLSNDWKYLLGELHEGIRDNSINPSRLFNLLMVCNETSFSKPTHPIESRYPILHAVTLLTGEEQDALITILDNPDNYFFKDLILADSIRLMLEDHIPSGWMAEFADNLKNHGIWHVSAEIWVPGGGLGRVMQYLGMTMSEFLKQEDIRLNQIEPFYQKYRGKNNEIADTGYAFYQSLPVPVEDLHVVEEFEVQVGSQKRKAICHKGRNKFGIDVYLIEDASGLCTKLMYNYETPDNPVTWEEFSEFLSRASLELIRRVELKNKNENADTWKAPLIHLNDSQLCLAPVYRKQDYSKDPIIGEAILAVSTHTYPNRHKYGWYQRHEKLAGMNIFPENWGYFYHLGDSWNEEVADVTSAGLRLADWTGAVSAKHADDVQVLDEWWFRERGINWQLIAVTNGDYRKFTTEKFRNAMQSLYPDVDVEHPTPQQVLNTKKECKKRVERVSLDPNKPVVCYTGRLVDEKTGIKRAFTPSNIETLVQMGVQVVIYGNAQGNKESQEIKTKLEALEKRLSDMKYPGKFIFISRFDIDDQRELLAAADIQALDSDEKTEAAGFTETDIAACGGLVLAPSWTEGILQAQGIKINMDIPGEGNTLIPLDSTPQSYLTILRLVLNKTPEILSEYQATSIRLSRILEARLTAAEQLRQYSYAIAKKESKRPVHGPGLATAVISLTGAALTEGQHESFKKAWRQAITFGYVTSLFADRKAVVADDVDIRQDDTKGEFYDALKSLKDKVSQNFDVIIGDDEAMQLPAYIAMHPGNERDQAYIPKSYLERLSDFYDILSPEYRTELIQIIGEAFEHEDMHIRQYRSTLGGQGPPISERDIDRLASSFRARALFRLIYAYHKTDIKPDIRRFFDVLRQNNRERLSYLNGYDFLTPEAHLNMARIFLSGSPQATDVILAQHHLGAIFNHADMNSKVFQDAIKVLHMDHAIDNGPETGRPFPTWKFIRELVRQNMLIEEKRPLDKVNVKASSLDQFEPWVRGTETTSGDSTLYPVPGKTTTLPVERITVIEKITAMDHLDNAAKADIIHGLVSDEKGGTVISREALEKIGAPLIIQCAVGTSGAGRGTRYAEIAYDENGKKFVLDTAKGTYRIPMDGNRSILEVLVAQVRGINNKYGANMPLDIYTSHFTYDDISGELKRLGFKEKKFLGIFNKGVYTHPVPGTPEIRIIRIRKTSLFDSAASDFYRNIEPSLPWTEVFWPDAHDTAFIDFIVSGRAYECVKGGFRYKFISNIDNRAAIPDPVILAIMKLTDASLVNEAVLKPKGAKGGAQAKFKNGNIPDGINFGNQLGILEEYEFDKKFLQGLTQGEIEKYFPLFNSANYTEDIIGFTRQAFMPGLTDEEISKSLKEFYDARDNPEKISELRFKLENVYRHKTQQWERDKRYPALQPSNLAGTLTWLVPTLFLEVPAGPAADVWTRFEPLKENIVNYQKERQSVQLLTNKNSSGTLVADATLGAGESFMKDEAQLSDIKTKYRDKSTLTLGQLAQNLDRNIKDIEDGLSRVERKKVQQYGAQDIPKGAPEALIIAGKLRGPAEVQEKTVEETMKTIHELNLKLLPPVEEGKTLVHVMMREIIPYSIRGQFERMVNSLNRDYKTAREKIVIVSRIDFPDEIARLAADTNNIIDVAVSHRTGLRRLPKGVKGLVFTGSSSNAYCFKQLEGILAALRALQQNNTSALVSIYAMLTGERFAGDENEILKYLDDPLRLSRVILFKLKPISVQDYDELKRLNSALIKLLESA